MAKLNQKEIRKVAVEIILQNPNGVRYSDLVRAIADKHPETPVNTIHGSIWDLHQTLPKQITKPSRGLFVSATQNQNSKHSETIPPATQKLYESDFYQPFADWLKNDLDEVTIAIALGGAGLKNKWGTPDVVGVYKPLASNLIKFSPEIVSAEIKIDPQQPVVAFGQAVAYRLFSTKTYVAMPVSMGLDDQNRLESLCMLFGVGLVLFELNKESPKFTIRVRAQRFSPDMFYVNEFAERLKESDSEMFEKLFAGIH